MAHPAPDITSPQPNVADQPAVVATERPVVTAAPHADVVAPSTRTLAPRTNSDADAGVMRFVSLPTAVGLPSLESGRIVRVEVPIAMLPSLGFDIGPDPPQALVEADVLVGQDGQPRAIRLISSDSRQRRQ